MIKSLLMLRLRAVFGSMTGKNKKGEYVKPSPVKIVLFALLYLYLAVTFIFLSVMICTSVGMLFIPAGESELYFAMISGISFSVIFILSIFETKSELFDCKDNEFLLSMPIPAGSVVVARIFTVLVYNYITEAIVAIPAAIVYLVISGGELLGFFGSLITSLLTPLAATALASAVGYLVAVMSKKVKNKTFITMFFSIAFMALYFVGYSQLFGITDDTIDPSAIAGKLAMIKPIGAASLMSPLPLVIYISVCLALAIIAYRVIAAHYMKIVTSSYGTKRAEYKAKSMKNSGALLALTKKELRLFVSSATYMLNAGIGVILELVLAVMAVVKRNEVLSVVNQLISEMGMPLKDSSLTASAVVAMLVLIASTVIISACSVSLEGKNLWIVRTSPVSARTVLVSKALAHLAVSVPPALISALVLCFALEISPLLSVAVLLIAIAANVFTALLGVVINTAFPKFVYDNEAQPIKQSLSTFLVMMIMMLLGAGLSVLGIVMSIFSLGWLFMLITLAAFVTLGAVLAVIMIYPCAKRFDSFSVS